MKILLITLIGFLVMALGTPVAEAHGKHHHDRHHHHSHHHHHHHRGDDWDYGYDHKHHHYDDWGYGDRYDRWVYPYR